MRKCCQIGAFLFNLCTLRMSFTPITKNHPYYSGGRGDGLGNDFKWRDHKNSFWYSPLPCILFCGLRYCFRPSLTLVHEYDIKMLSPLDWRHTNLTYNLPTPPFRPIFITRTSIIDSHLIIFLSFLSPPILLKPPPFFAWFKCLLLGCKIFSFENI